MARRADRSVFFHGVTSKNVSGSRRITGSRRSGRTRGRMRGPSTACGSTALFASVVRRSAVGAQPNGKPVDLRPSSSEAEAIILEGTAEYVTDPSHSLAAQSMAASREKYPQYFSGNDVSFRPFWALRPTTAFAWTLQGFPRGATRWRFEKS